jgi:RPA family protein
MQPAYKVKIEDIVKGQFVRSAEGVEPDYLVTPWGQKINRARVMGTIVDKYVSEDQSYAALHIDDGSETIRLKLWRQDVSKVANINVGDIVDVIGRIREYGGETYLVPDVIISVSDPNWEIVRELEVLGTRKQLFREGKRPQVKKVEPQVRTLEVEVPPQVQVGRIEGEIEELEEEPLPDVPDDVKKKVLMVFDKLDKGDGISPTDISTELNLTQDLVDDAMRVLIADGEIFEPKVGKFRRLR